LSQIVRYRALVTGAPFSRWRSSSLRRVCEGPPWHPSIKSPLHFRGETMTVGPRRGGVDDPNHKWGAAHRRPMNAIIPRREWLTFRAKFGEADRRFDALGPRHEQESGEGYLLSLGTDANAKIRDGLMDVKTLEQLDADGLEQWRPVMKDTFSLPAAEVALHSRRRLQSGFDNRGTLRGGQEEVGPPLATLEYGGKCPQSGSLPVFRARPIPVSPATTVCCRCSSWPSRTSAPSTTWPSQRVRRRAAAERRSLRVGEAVGLANLGDLL